ncbi:hypothetical protein [Emergencia sp. 1XD21-10]|uniref:hypothetical protein n=1 Tax=Emergencia sp. 1XD21-10 TaxID=2304569 RepID=UPI00137B79E6|nr:hypothetical protein [Emergencia sp. 1XD21-10]NCE99444.1 hypothetical protein [Emergencia sp. 1XD21-10]
MVLYNAFLAVVIVGIAYVIGEWVSTITRAWVPSVLVTAIIFLIGFWTVIPKTVSEDSGLSSFAGTIGVLMFITHIGTVISLKQLVEQWKTVVVCLVGLVGMVALCWFICPIIMDKNLVIAGLPPLTGGIVAALTMQGAAEAAGLKEAAVFAIAMYSVQGLAGYPITALCLHSEGRKLLKEWRSGDLNLSQKEIDKMKTVGLTTIADDSGTKKLIPPLPDKFNTPVFIIVKLALSVWLSSIVGQLIPQIPTIVWCLIISVILTRIGFLDTSLMTRANTYTIFMFAAMLSVFSGLADCTPSMLKALIVPMLIMIVIGVAGMALAAFIIAKLFHMDFQLAFANGLTALYGFPCDAIITENTCNSLTDDPDERGYLMSKMFPSMVVGGFVTVTITSVIFAGYFATLLGGGGITIS